MSDIDDTGRSRIVRNLLSSWASQLILIAIGFIMPRIIDHHIGQRLLGIWDFGWSLVSYLGLVGMGVGSAVNRYVGRFRATREWERLNRYIASVVVIQLVVTVIVVVATIVLANSLPALFFERLGDDAATASIVIYLLGFSFALTMLFDPARGIISGSHRWDVHNSINVGSHVLASIGMIIALLLGHGLVGMSVAYFSATLLMELLRYVMARRICPQISIRLSRARRHNLRELLRFGLKSVVVTLPRVFVIQTSSIMLLNSVGPAAVAILSRPLSLVGHITLFVDRFAHLLTPTVGALQGLGKEREMHRLMLESTRFAAAIALPPTLFLAINGDWLIRIWMGSDYVDHAVIALLSFGFFLPAAQSPVLSVLVGLNMHGRLGLITLVVSAAAMAGGIVTASYIGWSTALAAATIAAGVGIGHGIALPALACRALHISYLSFVRAGFLLPVMSGLGFAVILFAGRAAPVGSETIRIIVSSGLAGAFVALVYWRYLVPEEFRKRVRARLRLSPSSTTPD